MGRNVALLCLDTVRKDYFDRYAPRLQERAGTTFERAYAASSWSMPSHGSIFTETLPHRHDLHPAGVGTFAGLDPEDTFLRRLPDHATYGISANAYAGSGFGFDGLFDDFLDYSPTALFQNAVKPQVLQNGTDRSGRDRYAHFLRRSFEADRTVRSLANGLWGVLPGTKRLARSPAVPVPSPDGAAEMTSLASRTLSSSDEPFFAFANFMDAHVPLEARPAYDDDRHSVPPDWHSDDLDDEVRRTPEPHGDHADDVERYRQLYGCAIDYLDRVVASFVDDLMASTREETTVVVVSDHGENLGYESDEYLLGHNSMSRAILQTPCVVVNPPDGFPETVSAPFSHLQLGELLTLIGTERSFDPGLTNDVVPAEVPRAGGIKRSEEPEAPRFERMIRCLIDADGKFLWDSLGDRRTYEFAEGFPFEERLVREGDPIPETAEAFFAEPIEACLDRMDGSGADAADIDPATRGQLEELGYL